MLAKMLFSLLLAVAPSMAAAATRTVVDAEGTSVVVPAAPQRIATLSEIDLDACMALGLTPVGTVNGRGQKAPPHYLLTAAVGETVRKIPIVGDLGRPNLEALVAAKPDVILTAPGRPEVLAMLRKIAPTVVTFKNDERWLPVFERIAAILGREAQAKEFLAAYAAELQAAKTKLAAQQGTTASIVRWNPNGPAFMYEDSFASLVLRELGLVRPEAQRVPGQKHSQPVSLEALATIDGDWLFLGTLEPKGDAAEALAEIGASAAFQKLGAVKAKRHRAVDGSLWTSVGGPLAALTLVKQATDLMTEGTPTH